MEQPQVADYSNSSLYSPLTQRGGGPVQDISVTNSLHSI